MQFEPISFIQGFGAEITEEGSEILFFWKSSLIVKLQLLTSLFSLLFSEFIQASIIVLTS